MSSAIIDMNDDANDLSDYETPFDNNSGFNVIKDDNKVTKDGKAEGMMDDMQKNVTSYIFQNGKAKATQAFSTYANLDYLRPYFDVEPSQVRIRLLRSLVPRIPGSSVEKLHRELYGPVMLVFTLIAILLFQMKTSGHAVQEGTLMGTAFGVAFGYWLGASLLVWFVATICNTHITILQLLSLLGYALFGHCIVVLSTTLIHTSHDHIFFYLMFLVFGGLSTLKMISILGHRTMGRTQKMIVCGFVAAFHLSFLLYLHFAYHEVVEVRFDLSNHHPDVPVTKFDFQTKKFQSFAEKLENPLQAAELKKHMDNPGKKIARQDDEIKKEAKDSKTRKRIERSANGVLKEPQLQLGDGNKKTGN